MTRKGCFSRVQERRRRRRNIQRRVQQSPRSKSRGSQGSSFADALAVTSTANQRIAKTQEEPIQRQFYSKAVPTFLSFSLYHHLPYILPPTPRHIRTVWQTHHTEASSRTSTSEMRPLPQSSPRRQLLCLRLSSPSDSCVISSSS